MTRSSHLSRWPALAQGQSRCKAAARQPQAFVGSRLGSPAALGKHAIQDHREIHSALSTFQPDSKKMFETLWEKALQTLNGTRLESLLSTSAWATGSTCAWNKKHQQESKWSRLTTCSNWGGTSHGKWEQLTKTFPFSLFTALIPASLAAGRATSAFGSTWPCAKSKIWLGMNC